MTVCFFGNYLKDYPRVATLRQGLVENKIKVLECHTRKVGVKKVWSLYKQHQLIKNDYDLLIVMMGGQTLVWFARLISNKKVIFDAFTSLYLTNIEDRKTNSRFSPKAIYYKFWDWFPCFLASKILLDTDAQIDYFVKKYKIKRGKFIRLPISADPRIYYPIQNNSDKFIVHWHGYIVPFYSIETIIKSAEILKGYKDIQFQIVTRFNGKYWKIKKMCDNLNLKNVKFYPETDYSGIARYINQSHLCLGVFGDNKKARLVIPNKIIEAVACAKPVITADQPAIHELFVDRENIILCKTENSPDLAKKILMLRDNQDLATMIKRAALNLYMEKLVPAAIVKNLKY